jgi:hypothetical protein
MDFVTAALIVASFLVLVLAVYALYLAARLRKQQAQVDRAQVELAEQLQGKNAEARQSIQIIARALLQKDLTDTEAAMRIAYLSQQVLASEAEKQQFTVFQQLAQATSHIPILDDWAFLEKSEKRRLTAERESIEATYSDFIAVGAEQLAEIKLG